MFDYTSLHIDSEIRTVDKPLAIERLHLDPASASSKRTPFFSPAHLGPYQYFCSFYICKVGLDAGGWSRLENELQPIVQRHTQPGESYWGVSTLVEHGLVVRALSKRGSELAAGLLDFWRAAKRALYGRDAIPPRKIY
jgi:urease accessory protein